MYEIIKQFKKNIPRQKKLFQIYLQDCKIQNFSYDRFKKENVAFIEIKDYLMNCDEYNNLSIKQIDNMFEYLKTNLCVEKFSNLKKVYKQLNSLSDFLSQKYNLPYKLHGNASKENCLYLINKIIELKTIISKRVNRNVLEIENIISFETITGQILNPKEYIFDERKILFLIDNMNYIFGVNRNNNDFNTIFCLHVENAKVNKEKKKINYYKKMYIFLSTIKNLYLDKKYLNNLFDINYEIVDRNIINKKINSMRISKNTGLRIVDDYILSIDSDSTKKIDDAFSIEKIENAYLIGIHIANVNRLGYFDEENFNIYKNNNIRKSDASLVRNKERCAVSLYVLIDNNGFIKNYKLLNTSLVTDVNLVFNDIPKILGSNDTNPVLKESIINLISVYSLIENTRYPANPSINNLGYVITDILMILYGSIMSYELTENGFGIYLCGDSKNNYYSLDSKPFNTGFKDYHSYLRSTSPIIERLSLINQFFIERYLISNRCITEEEKDEYTLKLSPIVDKLNKKENKKINY